MKFDRPVNFKKWTKEQTNDRIKLIWQEIKVFNKMLNRLDSRINQLKEEKRIIGIKIGNKHRYIKQLEKQLQEIDSEEWQEI